MDWSEGEMFITGEFGQVVLLFRHTKIMLDDLTVNLELKLYLFGKQSLRLCQPPRVTKVPLCWSMKGIIVNSVL